MSYKLDSMPTFGFIQKLSDNDSYLLDDLKDSGATNTSGVTIDFSTNTSFIGRLIQKSAPTGQELIYHIGTNSSYGYYYGMIPMHGVDVFQQLGSEEAYNFGITVAPGAGYQSGTPGDWSKDSHIQYWRLK